MANINFYMRDITVGLSHPMVAAHIWLILPALSEYDDRIVRAVTVLWGEIGQVLWTNDNLDLQGIYQAGPEPCGVTIATPLRRWVEALTLRTTIRKLTHSVHITHTIVVDKALLLSQWRAAGSPLQW